MNITTEQLRVALHLRQQIELLESKLSQLLDGGESNGVKTKKRLSEAHKLAIGRGQSNRWFAETHKKVAKTKRTPKEKARLSRVMRKRWRVAKAAGKTRL